MSCDKELDLLRREIGTILESKIRPLLPQDPGFKLDYQLTFIARVNGNDELDVVVTQEDYAKDIIDLINRRWSL